MSAYAALLSLQHILVTVLHPRRWNRIRYKKVHLQILLEETCLLLNFLDSSSTYKPTQISALETKMRDAAYKAEDLIDHGILDSNRRIRHDSTATISIPCFLTLFFFILLIPDLNVSYIVVEVVLCTMNALLLYHKIRNINVSQTLDDSQELRRVLDDFDIIMKEVIQIKEARGEGEMSSHDALVSLEKILDSILDGSGERGHLRSLHEMVSFLMDFLGYAPTTYMSTSNFDATIRHAVYTAKRALVDFENPRKFSLHFDFSTTVTLIDSSTLFQVIINMLIRIMTYTPTYVTQAVAPDHFILLWLSIITFASYMASIVLVQIVLAAKDYSVTPKNQELHLVMDDFRVIVRDAIEIKDAAYGNQPSNLPPHPAAAAAASSSSSRQDLGGTSRDIVVGLDGDLLKMKERLLKDSSNRELAFIVGMGGIGKTTLARQVYENADICAHFDVHAWVTVSQEYSLRHVLLCLLHSAGILTEEEEKCQDDDDKLALYLHQYLMHRRYLIVMDDMWDLEIWDFVSRFFPENDNGSRILITSRLPSVASLLDSSNPLHHMQCLNEDDSWDLLSTKVFGEEGCPLELEAIGREIATSCRGLPLAIIVIGGLLYKDIQIEIWRDVAEKLKKSELQDIKEHCLEILGLSYNHLPHHLRPCFLYMAVLPRDGEIPISRLINLWVAEGFLEPCTSKTIEGVGEGYLEDLIDRNLILVCKKSCNGKTRMCSVHDLLRDVCVQNARKEKFLHVMDSEGNVLEDESPRRLSTHPDALQVDAKHDYVRSVICIASKSNENPSGFYLGFVHLRVLDVLEVHFGEFPHQITKLFRLRYLAFHCDGSLPPSISKLHDLLTLVHHFGSFREYPLLPTVIWSMPKLRHVYVKPGCYFSVSLSYQLLPPSSFLVNLQTLVGIRNFEWSKGITERIPNLKKLGVTYDVPSCVDWSTYQLDSLVDLHQLETLKIVIKYDDLGAAISCDPPKLSFPQKLKKLSLSGCRIQWAEMTLTGIGALPNLQALKLRRKAFCGPSWETVEGEFPELMFLLLEEMSFTRWETEEAHFPRLQRLVIRSCVMLEEVPCSLGDIPTLEMIELVDCHPSAVASAMEIQEEQESMGNEVLKFHIKQRRGEREEDEMESSARRVYPGRVQVLIDVLRNDILFVSASFEIGAAYLVKKVRNKIKCTRRRKPNPRPSLVSRRWKSKSGRRN